MHITTQADRKFGHKYNIAAITPYITLNIVMDTYHSTVSNSACFVGAV